MNKKIKILVVGCGRMGRSHGLAYHEIEDFEVVGVVNRGEEKRRKLSEEMGGVAEFSDFGKALAETSPNAVSINTYPDTHSRFAIQALEAGAHVFVEKPLAETAGEAQAVIDIAKKSQKKIVVGYILRHHPSWIQFVEKAKELGHPLVMRMNLNQQSSGSFWEIHKKLMGSMSPIVDCGVHYVDIMCQITQSAPAQISAIGSRLSSELHPEMYNYGQLQIIFENGSVGWYEASWGPMVSESSHFIKNVIGPKGSVSMVSAIEEGQSGNINTHTAAEKLLIHHAELDESGEFARADERIDLNDEPGHRELCKKEQLFFLKAIQENLDLSEHHRDVIHSLKIVLAADTSIRKRKPIVIQKEESSFV